MKLTEEELSGLSAEERAAMLEEDENEIDGASNAETAVDDEEEEGAAPEVHGENNAQATDAVDEVAQNGDATDAAATESSTAENHTEERFTTSYHAIPVENYAEKVAQLREQERNAYKLFQEGELTPDGLSEELAKIGEDRLAIERQQIKAEVSAESQEQAAAQLWEHQINTLMRNAKKEDGIDYRENKLLNAALDAAVKELANDHGNADKDGEWFLNEAHRSVKETMGIKTKALEPPPRRGHDASKLPTTLSSLPAAEINETGSDEFAYLDKLEGIDLEVALAKMPIEQQNRYLRVEG